MLNTFTTYRHDRTDQRGGGVFISVISKYTSWGATELATNSESLWVQIKLTRHRKLLVNSFYRPPTGGENALKYFKSFCDNIHTVCSSNPNTIIWLGGDYNLPDIDWINFTIHHTAP